MTASSSSSSTSIGTSNTHGTTNSRATSSRGSGSNSSSSQNSNRNRSNASIRSSSSSSSSSIWLGSGGRWRSSSGSSKSINNSRPVRQDLRSTCLYKTTSISQGGIAFNKGNYTKRLRPPILDLAHIAHSCPPLYVSVWGNPCHLTPPAGPLPLPLPAAIAGQLMIRGQLVRSFLVVFQEAALPAPMQLPGSCKKLVQTPVQLRLSFPPS